MSERKRVLFLLEGFGPPSAPHATDELLGDDTLLEFMPVVLADDAVVKAVSLTITTEVTTLERAVRDVSPESYQRHIEITFRERLRANAVVGAAKPKTMSELEAAAENADLIVIDRSDWRRFESLSHLADVLFLGRGWSDRERVVVMPSAVQLAAPYTARLADSLADPQDRTVAAEDVRLVIATEPRWELAPTGTSLLILKRG